MENKKLILIIVIAFLAIRCNSQKKDLKDYDYKKVSKELAEFFNGKDTIIKVDLPDSIYYSFKFTSKKKYKIYWGNSKIVNLSCKEFKTLGGGNLSLFGFNNKFIVLGQNCGQLCQKRIVLPISLNSEEKEYVPALISDEIKNIVVWIPNHNEFLRIENYLTNKYEDVKLNDLCPADQWSECIEKIYFKNSQLIIEYQGSNWADTKPDPKKKIVDIKNLE